MCTQISFNSLKSSVCLVQSGWEAAPLAVIAAAGVGAFGKPPGCQTWALSFACIRDQSTHAESVLKAS